MFKLIISKYFSKQFSNKYPMSAKIVGRNICLACVEGWAIY